MFGKTSKPMIKTIIGYIESKSQSHRGRKDFELGGVGLGIVAALDNNPGDGPTKTPAKRALFSRNLSRSKPIPSRVRGETDMDSCSEEYGVVTFHGEGSYSEVYVYPSFVKSHHVQTQTSIRVVKSKRSTSVFISPAKTFDDPSGIRASDDGFLSSCNMCLKKLHGKDIYMYRGEKAFCSTECRYKQILLDERKEKYCSSESSRTHVASAAVESNTKQIFTTAGILAS